MNNKEHDLHLVSDGLIAGIDEVGRGCLAGPLVVTALILPRDFYHPDIKDSKQLNRKQREALFEIILANCIEEVSEIVPVAEIDRLNIYQATKKAMEDACRKLQTPCTILVDHVPLNHPSISITHGDDLSFAVAAASIIAKVRRDRIMAEYDHEYPGYNFVANVGYGTKEHLEAIETIGITPIHRQSFAPVRQARQMTLFKVS